MIKHPFTEAEPSLWPSGYGDVLAMLSTSREEMESRFGLRFRPGFDNLGSYSAAAVRSGSGRVVRILRHDGDLADGVELHGDFTDGPQQAIDELLGALGLPPEACTWRRTARHAEAADP